MTRQEVDAVTGTLDVLEVCQLLAAHRGFNAALRHLSLGADLQSVLRELTHVVEAQAPGRVASVLLLDRESLVLRVAEACGLPDFYNEAVDGVAIGPRVGSCGAAAYWGRPVIAEDLSEHPNWSDFASLAARAGLAACWSVPIMSSCSTVLGTFAIYGREAGPPSNWELEVLDTASRIASVALEKRQADRAMQEAAFADELTGLRNRRGAIERLDTMVRAALDDEELLALVYLDLDGLKSVNDRFGHGEGDRLLRQGADALRRASKPGDLLARLGGDEFILARFTSDLNEPHEFIAGYEQMLSELLAPEARALGVGVSCGTVFANASSLNTSARLLEEADRRMYADKRRRQAARAGVVEPQGLPHPSVPGMIPARLR